MRDPELKVVRIPIGEFVPYENNAKRHTSEQISAVEESIKQFGFRNPVIVWENADGRPEVVAGHARVTAAKRLGMQEVPAIWCNDLSDAQRRALTLTDNQTTMMTGWDFDVLAYELDTLAQEFDMGDFGFEPTMAVDDFGDEIDLCDGDCPAVSQATFVLAPEQRDAVMAALKSVDVSATETFGNQNRNGNALYEVVMFWTRQKTSNSE